MGPYEWPRAVEGPWLDLTKIEKALAVNSGMMLVVAAWKIAELLELEAFADERQQTEEKYRRSA